MAITWTLRQWLALNHNIYRATDLQRVLAERAEYHLTVQAVSTLMKGPPSELRLRTIQALCKSLNCQLSDFCEVSPDDETTLHYGRNTCREGTKQATKTGFETAEKRNTVPHTASNIWLMLERLVAPASQALGGEEWKK